MERKRILVVAAVIRDGGGRILLARRPQHVHQGGLWEFPGGKVEPGEAERDALARELHEELDITPRVAEPLIRISHDYPDKSVTLSVWEVTAFAGHEAVAGSTGREGQDIAWYPPAALHGLSFPAANVPIVAAARLPRGWCITPALDTPDAVLAWASARLPGGAVGTPPGMGWLLRLPGWSDAAYIDIARHVLGLAQEAGLPLLLHGALSRWQALPMAQGVHLPAREAVALQQRPLPADRWLSVAAHDLDDLQRASRVGADCALLSPLRETASHPGRPGLGWETWSAWAGAAALPVYALGGMRPDDVTAVRAAGGQGVAGISGF